jgi:protein phosphatase methylesterase 1
LSTTSQTTGGGKKASLLVCHHGAGSSGTTFSALAKEVQEKSKGELGVLAFDARGHGKSDRTVYTGFE